ncbi:uncharacterized protein B0H18DRAFT_989852 [Fomitopsis serialis]|uniref:uncharacterized protein n=1 Tax=Fomitopsis serialis TaxID=139415 RepID=UPI00200846D0|nr:uncharacterized protein B0H18DRAFT_989852 [Neoantrodia serialis]KAH9931538.1 hypothetical protein B0H18DRAFT_989852 [Neoantrodia serialis]
MAPKLSPQARRLRTIIVTVPIMAATSCECTSSAMHVRSLLADVCPLVTVVLYKRLVLGEPQRTLPRADAVYPPGSEQDRRIIPLKTVTGKTGTGAGSTGGGDEEALMQE